MTETMIANAIAQARAAFEKAPDRIPLLCIVGPTASGKSCLAVELAQQMGGEVVSCDSMQVYRRMDIGTAKPTREEMGGIPHHMIDIVNPEVPYSCAEYVTAAREVISDIHAQNCRFFAAGRGFIWTGFCGAETTRGRRRILRFAPSWRRTARRTATRRSTRCWRR